MPEFDRDTLPEWSNLLAQINTLLGLVPQVGALSSTVASIDRNMAVVMAAIALLQADSQEFRRRFEHTNGRPGLAARTHESLSPSTLNVLMLGMVLLGVALLVLAIYVVVTR